MESSGLKWIIATDGSKISKLALDLVLENLYRKGDNLILSHIFSKEKSYLPRYLQYDYLF